MDRRGITKETFNQQETVEGRLSLLFDQQTLMFTMLDELKTSDTPPSNLSCRRRWDRCDIRFKKLERFGSWLLGGISVFSFIIASVSIALQFT